jgi:hypothetical protein
MTTLPTFRLQVTRPPARDPDRPEMSASSNKQGSFDYDREKGGYFLEWASLAEFDIVTTHCLLQAVVALVARTRGLKAILLEDRGDEGARVCS